MGGVFGAFDRKGKAVLEDIYLGLFALQHRGQESAGIAWIEEKETHTIKGMGLLHSAIDQSRLVGVPAHCAIGHVRYSQEGASMIKNAQPLAAKYARGPVAIAHDGAITNGQGLMRFLEDKGAIFQSICDTETILHLMAHQSHKPPLDALLDSLRHLQGGFALTVLLEDRLVAARDPWGFRPLVIGQRDDTLYVASESCALDIVGATLIRDVEPGELIVIDSNGITSLRIADMPERGYACAFEYVYLARPDSFIDGRSVNSVRKEMGRRLAKRCPCTDADLVAGMPDSGTLAALGYAEESSIPFELAIVRNRYVGRTFIQPTQRVRDLGVRIKLNPISSILCGKKAVIIDDSIVRGTTAQRVISMIRDSGAAEVHLRVASPPVRFPCYYGIDTPSSEHLIAARMDISALKEDIGADSLAYLTLEDLIEAIGLPPCRLCTACFDGEYLNGGGSHELGL